MTHRSPATKSNVLLGNVNDGVRFVRLFYRQPRWSELQSLVFCVPTGGTLFDIPSTFRAWAGAYGMRLFDR
jgi:hypothetical protein